MSSADPYDIQLVDTTAGFDRIRDDWKRLEQETGHTNLTASYDWLRTWWEAFADKNNNQFGFGKQLRILLLARQGTLVAIAPLLRLHRRRWLRKTVFIEFLGQQWSAQMLDFIAREPTPDVRRAVTAWLREHERFDVLHLSYIPESTPFFDIGDPRMTLLSACPIFYRKDYADFEAYKKAVYTKNFRNCVRKNYNRLEARRLKYECQIGPAREEHLGEMARLSMSKLGDGKHSHWLDPDKARFFSRLVATMPAEALFIRINGENVVYLLNFFFANGLFAYDTSYNRQYRDLSLGRLSFVESIKRFFAETDLAFHCAGTGLGFHKRGHYPGVMRIYIYTEPGNTRAAETRAGRVLAGNTRIAQAFSTDLAGWLEHE